MKHIQMLNKIAACGTDVFDKDAYEVATEIADPEAILVRSAAMHDMELAPSLRAIGRAGAGVNNIPVDRCTEQGIVVFNTPGANANGVKELTIAALILASRNVVGGIEWVNTLKGSEEIAKAVEKGKSAYVGHELTGKTLGVIGLGAIGGMVANAADALGMSVIGCDPYITVNAAWALSTAIKKASAYEEIYRDADYITLHVPATGETKGMICKKTIDMMKDGVRIINLARADLVNAEDMKEALASGKVAAYITDFPTEATVGVPGIVNIPHLGASTYESEDHCAVMACKQIKDYLENGNIVNSVNFPKVSMPRSGAQRICVLHRNVPSVLSRLTSLVSNEGINIENLSNGSRGEAAYTILDVSRPVSEETAKVFSKIEGVIRVTLL
ncbi:MAG: 3-phosphoglycerate dehydrogenase [Clostridia bacterium]|nr:3-phosphoglycerate dehydrogenase [Clostridia bacterium]